MIELNESQFNLAKPIAVSFTEDSVFINSVLSGSGFGRVFIDNLEAPTTALVWHRCGFAYICGKPSEGFLYEIVSLLYEKFEPNQRRFRLHLYSKAIAEFFNSLSGLKIWTQQVFSLNKSKLVPHYKRLADGYTLKEAELCDIEGFSGKITPSFSWASNEQFIREGKAFCAIYNSKVAAMAFTCAFGGKIVDIGIETAAEHRGKGLGKAVASKLAEYLLDNGYSPVWRCAESNPASRGIAEAVGFLHESEHNVYMKEPQ